jgi:hypothetical protein
MAERRQGRPWLQRGGLRRLSGDSAVHCSAWWCSAVRDYGERGGLDNVVLGTAAWRTRSGSGVRREREGGARKGEGERWREEAGEMVRSRLLRSSEWW